MRPSFSLISGVLLLAACGGGGGSGGGNPPSGEAETFYVNPTGSDDNDGLAPDRPFRTLVRAVDGLLAGDVVYVAPGTYPLLPSAPGEPQPTEVAEIRDIAGTAAQPVSIIADITGEKTGTDPGDVVVDANNVSIGLRVSRSTHIIIDGVRIIRAKGNNGAGIQVRSNSDDAIVRNCVITGGADGIRVENSNDPLIFNNLIYGNDNRGIRISNGSVRARIINNTIVDNRNRGIAIGGANAANVAPTGASLRNNIIQDNSNVSISIESGPPSALVGYSGNFNLVFYPGLADQTKTYRPTTIVGANDVNVDAEFVDVNHGALHLLPSSPAIDAGTGNIGDALLATLFDRATTADGAPDHPPVDMGYHYPAQ
jgi:parallel beta-helix repeat protein